jgi:hypothetical protein
MHEWAIGLMMLRRELWGIGYGAAPLPVIDVESYARRWTKSEISRRAASADSGAGCVR